MCAHAQTAAAHDRTIQYIKCRVLVKPRAGLSDKVFDKILQLHGGERGKRSPQINPHAIELPAQANEMAVANDPYLSRAWHLAKTGVTSVWDTAVGTGVPIAILDSGGDGKHPDLQAAMTPGWNFRENTPDMSDVPGRLTA